jgi:hypothetical protein
MIYILDKTMKLFPDSMLLSSVNLIFWLHMHSVMAVLVFIVSNEGILLTPNPPTTTTSEQCPLWLPLWRLAEKMVLSLVKSFYQPLRKCYILKD